MRRRWNRIKPWALVVGFLLAACAEVALDRAERAGRLEETAYFSTNTMADGNRLECGGCRE
jgi:hypothetical protein